MHWTVPASSQNYNPIIDRPTPFICIPGICIETISLESPVCMSQLFLMHIHL